jgi:PD-(D/E)XK endonuclease
MNTAHKGNISEVLVLGELLASGREVAIPYGNCPGFDLLVLAKDGKWKKIQVKTAYSRNGRAGAYVDFIRGSGKGKRRSYTKEDFDFLIAMKQDDRQFWVFPVKTVIGKRCVTVGSGSREWKNLEEI